MNVELVVNRRARGLGEESAVRRALLRAAAARGVAVHETWTLEELDAVARALTGRGADAVVLAGGDGSHMAGVSALARACGDHPLPRIALAPGGTVNTIARGLGHDGNARAWAERALDAACDGASAREQSSLRVTDDEGGDRVGFIWGAGLVAGFFDAYYAGHDQGLLSAGALAVRVLAGALVGAPLARRVLAPVSCRLAVDGVEHAHRAWSLVLASVLRDVGLHVRATYRAGAEPDRFHVVASGLRARGLAFEAHRVLRGQALRGEPHVDAQARSLALDFDGRGTYVLDGDVFAATAVRVEPGPTLRLALP
jgi:diacylglycerol kinase family enzyme